MLEVKTLTTITLNGSAQRVTTVETLCVAVIFQAPEDNTGNTVVACDSGVSADDGAFVAPGKELAFGGSDMHANSEVFDLSRFYVIGTNAEELRISYIKRV